MDDEGWAILATYFINSMAPSLQKTVHMKDLHVISQ
jgi:hypothetical protein